MEISNLPNRRILEWTLTDPSFKEFNDLPNLRGIYVFITEPSLLTTPVFFGKCPQEMLNCHLFFECKNLKLRLHLRVQIFEFRHFFV